MYCYYNICVLKVLRFYEVKPFNFCRLIVSDLQSQVRFRFLIFLTMEHFDTDEVLLVERRGTEWEWEGSGI